MYLYVPCMGLYVYMCVLYTPIYVSCIRLSYVSGIRLFIRVLYTPVDLVHGADGLSVTRVHLSM